VVRWYLDADDNPNSHQHLIISFWPIYNVCWNLHANSFRGISSSQDCQLPDYGLRSSLKTWCQNAFNSIHEQVFFRWDISVIFAETFWSPKHFGHLSHSCIELAVKVFSSLYFQTFWPKLLNFFGHFKNISVYDQKMNEKKSATETHEFFKQIKHTSQHRRSQGGPKGPCPSPNV